MKKKRFYRFDCIFKAQKHDCNVARLCGLGPDLLPVGLCTVGPVKEGAERISLVSFEDLPSETARSLWQTCSACASWPLRGAGWTTRVKRFAGFSEYADCATQSPASTGCVAHCCAARTGSASQTVASQPLASRALVASRLGAARQCQCLTPLFHSPSLLSFREMHYGAGSVSSTRVLQPYYSAAFYAGVQ